MRIVEPDQARAVRGVQGKAIGDAVGPRARTPSTSDLEFDPIAMREHEGLAVVVKQKIPSGVARRHVTLLS